MSKETKTNQFSEEEKALAAKFGVEPKTVRLIDSIAQEKLKEPEQSTEGSITIVDKDPNDQTDEIVKQWLLSRDYTTKLAFIILWIHGFDDYGKKELSDEIIDSYMAEVEAATKNPPDKMSQEERILTGVAKELLDWLENYSN